MDLQWRDGDGEARFGAYLGQGPGKREPGDRVLGGRLIELSKHRFHRASD
jgi:hypothetical protein